MLADTMIAGISCCRLDLGIDILILRRRHLLYHPQGCLPSIELDQVLKDELTPAISACLHKQPAF